MSVTKELIKKEKDLVQAGQVRDLHRPHDTKHLNTSLLRAEILCGKGFEMSEVFGKLLTELVTQLLTR